VPKSVLCENSRDAAGVKATASPDDLIGVDRLWELYRDLGNSLDLDETLSTLDRALARLVEYDAISVHVDEDGWSGCAYSAGREFAKLAQCPPDLSAPGLPVAMRVRLQWKGRSVGVLSLYRTGMREFAEGDLTLVHALAPKLAACIQNARRFHRVEAANRRALFERLDAEIARIRRSDGRLAVLDCAVLDLDCREILSERIAAELRRVCREYDFVARSGDGFLVVLADFAPSALNETKARIARVFREAGMGARIGAALFPVDGSDAEDLLAAAHGAAHA
jgi:GGDEF domain-containing protein